MNNRLSRKLALLGQATACLLAGIWIIGCNQQPSNAQPIGFTVGLTRDSDGPFPGMITSNDGYLNIESKTTIEEIDGNNYFTSTMLPSRRATDPNKPPFYVKTSVRYDDSDRQVMEILLKCTMVTRLEFPFEASANVDVRLADTNRSVSAPWEFAPGEYKLLARIPPAEQQQDK